MRASARLVPILVAAALLVPLAGGEIASVATRHVRGLVADPTPLDAASWRVEVPAGVVVCVDATEAGPALFAMRATHGERTISSPLPLPGQGAILDEGAWTLSVDPIAGARFDITVRLAGHQVDCGQEPAAFTITDLSSGCGDGACLL
ncbi:MAG: hypothetical protein QOE90_3196 [Thermoplasmata archaeon]|jgi:hypothetical protein|nr:hypothetical protein [Thermoplasmata archaeon]